MHTCIHKYIHYTDPHTERKRKRRDKRQRDRESKKGIASIVRPEAAVTDNRKSAPAVPRKWEGEKIYVYVYMYICI